MKESYLYFVIFLQILEGEGSHDAVGHDQRDEYHVREDTRAYLPRVMKESTAPARRSVFSFVQHLAQNLIEPAQPLNFHLSPIFL